MEITNQQLEKYKTLRNTLDYSEQMELTAVAMLLQSRQISVFDLASVCGTELINSVMGIILEFEAQIINDDNIQLPAVLEENEDAIKYEDGLWYPKWDCISDVCPLCGKGSDINYTGDYFYECCDECKVRWEPNPVLIDSVYKQVRGQKANKGILARLAKYKTTDQIYSQSKVKGINFDRIIREKLNDIERRRTHENSTTNDWEKEF